MLEPPPGLSDQVVMRMVRSGWPLAAEVDEIVHLAVGFGAHHWRADAGGAPELFVTFDQFRARHTAVTLENAYGAAARLNLDFVVAPLANRNGAFIAPLAGGAASCTPWMDGPAAGDGPISNPQLAALDIAALAALHAADPPPNIPRWHALVTPDFGAELASRLDGRWDTGPFGEQARVALLAHREAVLAWTNRYHQLAGQAAELPWVPTHGEPHSRNQMMTPAGVRFVDWESLAMAPRERDLGPLVVAGYAAAVRPRWAMMEMFDLEWRLDEISQYASWLCNPHTGTASDRTALEGLLAELTRPQWRRPG